MATSHTVFDSTPATLVADLKTNILLSADWANIGGGTGHIVKATTTRGAQMVVDLSNAAATSNRLQMAVYRTHDGTTGVDGIVRYLTYNSVSPATNTVLHCIVSAGKEHLFISVEGPRSGENGAENGTWGSPRQILAMTDVVPYHAADTQPAVALIAHLLQSTSDNSPAIHVSRNQGNSGSWVRGFLNTLTRTPQINAGMAHYSSLQPVAKGDAKYYVWPFVVIETADGLRGRLSKFFWAGATVVQTPDEVVPSIGQNITYSGEGYTIQGNGRSSQNYEAGNGFGYWYRANGLSAAHGNPGHTQLIAVPNGL